MSNQTTEGLFSHWLRKQRMKKIARSIQGRVFDFGCGGGELLEYLPTSKTYEYFGFDVNPLTINTTQKKYPNHLFSTEIPSQTSQNRQFDTIVMAAVIEHLPSPTETLQLLKTFLNPGGKILITTPHRAFGWIHTFGAILGLFSLEANREHHLLFDKNSLKKISEDTGMILLHYERFLFGANQFVILENPKGYY